jgi:oligoendopeptidase F
MQRTLLMALVLLVATGAADPTRTADLDRAYQDMVTAQRALDHAKQRRDQMEPKEGERAGTAKGGSRLLPEYFERQRSLEREVALAQWRYDQAVERWNALR